VISDLAVDRAFAQQTKGLVFKSKK